MALVELQYIVMLFQCQMKQHQQVQEELREMNEVYQKSKVWLAVTTVQTRACSFVHVTCQVCVYTM